MQMSFHIGLLMYDGSNEMAIQLTLVWLSTNSYTSLD